VLGAGRPAARSVERLRPSQKPCGGYVKTFTARAMTSARMAIEMSAYTAMVILAQGTSGMASVGLKAVAFVKPRYR
jgi:hypothetical protein